MISPLDAILDSFSDRSSLVPPAAVFAAALALSLLLARLVYHLLERVVRRWVGRTQTTLDDLLLDALELPVVSGVVLLGAYAGVVLAGWSDAPGLGPIGKVLLIFWGALAFYRTLSALLSWYAHEVAPRHHLALGDLEALLRRLGGVAIFSISAIMALDAVGVEVSPLVASLGIAGLAVALAFQDTLANFFAGIHLSVDRPLKAGDYVELEGGQNGYVVKVGWRSTSIRTLPNNIVYIPNSKLASTTITNYYSPDKEMAVVFPVSVGYGSDLAQVERAAVEVATVVQKTVPGAVRDFTPFIRYNKFDSSGINFSVILRVGEFVDQYLVTHEFVKALHARFSREGIEFPFPKRSVYVERVPRAPRPRSASPRGRSAPSRAPRPAVRRPPAPPSSSRTRAPTRSERSRSAPERR